MKIPLLSLGQSHFKCSSLATGAYLSKKEIILGTHFADLLSFEIRVKFV